MTTSFNMNATPPKAAKHPVKIEQLGHTRVDDYAWMKDENWQAVMQDPTRLDADIREYLDAENAYTETVLAPLDALKTTLFEELKGRLEPEAATTPLPDGDWAYFHFYRPKDQYGIYARLPLSDPKAVPVLKEAVIAQAETVLDAEIIAKDFKAYFDLGAVSHSPDHKWVAYNIDSQGSENYEVYLRELGTDNPPVETQIKKSAGALIWADDSRTLFWVERDENQRPHAVMRLDIFDSEARPICVYEESDPGFFVSIGQSDDLAHIEISAHNHTTTEIWRLPSAKPETAPVCFTKRQTGLEYSLSDQGGATYILTNAEGAVDFQIKKLSSASNESAPEHWEDFIPHMPGTLILGMEAFENYLVRLERKDALPRIVIRDMRTQEEHIIAMDEPAYGLGLVSGYEYKTERLYFSYASPTTPSRVYAYNMATRERKLVKEQVVPSGHTPEHYVTERLSIAARDGAMILVTVLRRSDVAIDGKAPLLLYGYGSYGITIPASFRTTILSLVDRGFVYAIAHIRGSMAKGYQWYLDGKLDKKPNTFNDFVDVGHGLCELGYTRRGRVVAHGGSAGGLLVGAALNQAPDLFASAIAAVPFVDVLNTMSDTSLPLTPPEWPEWGNPLVDETAYTQIEAYSPYDQVTHKAYPHMLITGGLTDPRVTYWEPAKWAAKLREHQTGESLILLKINMEAGHQGESGRYDSLKETALEYAFALASVGQS